MKTWRLRTLYTVVLLCAGLAASALAAGWHSVSPLHSGALDEEIRQASETIRADPELSRYATSILYWTMTGQTRERDALKVFIGAEATPLVRQALTVPYYPNVMTPAAEYLGQKRDRASLPELVNALERTGFLMPGSEEATAHKMLQYELLAAIEAITGLHEEADAVRPERRFQAPSISGIRQFVERVRAWANRQDVELYPPAPAEPPEEPPSVADRIDWIIASARTADTELELQLARGKLRKLRDQIDAALKETRTVGSEPDADE